MPKTTAERVAAYRRRQRERLAAAEARVADLEREIAAARARADQATAAAREAIARYRSIESHWIVRLARALGADL